ncbi:hypothetical protein ACFVHW_07685 [Streptomyces sp. NPDC127110]|uniref:hypothetical protein n=1 Tax=Streptomyces sp. NPDC127110 TaxID=3345362 RepID=UPI00362EF722
MSAIRILAQGLTAALSCGFDRNMRPCKASYSAERVDSHVNAQVMPFIGILFAGVILIREPQLAEPVIVLLPVLVAAGRRSAWGFARTRHRIAGHTPLASEF